MTASTVLLATLIMSNWWELGRRDWTYTGFGVLAGRVYVQWRAGGSFFHSTGRKQTFARRSAGGLHWWPQWSKDPSGGFLMVPLWIPFALFALPTAIIFYRDDIARRRARLGGCLNCGYDRRGIDAAIPCPECGAAPVSPAP